MKLKKYLKNPWEIVISLNNHNLLRILSDKLYLKLMFRARIGKKLNLKNPQSFNEKIQWLKLYNRKEEYTAMVDKYAVKDYVKKIIGDKYIIPTLGVWNKYDEINFSSLPNKFVLKCTHDSGGLYICKNKDLFNNYECRKKIENSLKNKYFYKGREWPYKNVKPQIIAEVYLEDENVADLYDYKVMAFNGVPKIIQVHKGRHKNHTQDFYDDDWNKLNIYQGTEQSDEYMDKPIFFDEMMQLTSILAKNIPLVRVDWYYVKNQLFFGEITFYDGSGLIPFIPESWDYEFGKMIKLEDK